MKNQTLKVEELKEFLSNCGYAWTGRCKCVAKIDHNEKQIMDIVLTDDLIIFINDIPSVIKNIYIGRNTPVRIECKDDKFFLLFDKERVDLSNQWIKYNNFLSSKREVTSFKSDLIKEKKKKIRKR